MRYLLILSLLVGQISGAAPSVPPEASEFVKRGDKLLKRVEGIGRGGLAEGISRHLQNDKVRAALGGTAEALLCFFLEGVGTMVQTAVDVVVDRAGETLGASITNKTGPLLRDLAELDIDIQELWMKRCEDKPPGNSAHVAWLTAYRETFPEQYHRSTLTRTQLLVASQRLSVGLFPGYGISPAVSEPREAALLTLTILLMLTPVPGDEIIPMASLRLILG